MQQENLMVIDLYKEEQSLYYKYIYTHAVKSFDQSGAD